MTERDDGGAWRPGLQDVGGPAGVAALVRELVTIMRDGGVTELDLAVGPLTVRLRGKRRDSVAVVAPASGPPTAQPAPGNAEHIITAPMIGTFYSAPSPGARPFVQIGDQISVGQVVGIIEAMKIMNEIVAEASGTVTEILAANGQPVEYGSPLLALTPDAA